MFERPSLLATQYHPDSSALPRITGHELNVMLMNYHKKKSGVDIIIRRDAVRKIDAIAKGPQPADKPLPAKDLLTLIIVLAKLNPSGNKLLIGLLSSLLRNVDGRVLVAVKGTLDLGVGISDGTCLQNCLNLMCKHPEEAQYIAMAKSLLCVLYTLGLKKKLEMAFVKKCYRSVNNYPSLSKEIFNQVKTLGKFGELCRDPAAAEKYLQESLTDPQVKILLEFDQPRIVNKI